MTEDSLELSRRKVLSALTSIGIGSAAVGAGTFAAFSDEDTSSDSLKTGTLNLDFDTNKNGQLSLSTNKLRPGDTGKEAITLENAGALDGTLSVTLDSISNSSTASPDSETSGGQLSDALQMRMWVEPLDGNDGNTSLDGDSDEIQLLSDGTTQAADTGKVNLKTADQFYDTDAADPTSPVWDSGDSMPTLQASDDYNLMFDWKLPEDASNLNDISDIDAVQGDKSTFNFTFTITGT